MIGIGIDIGDRDTAVSACLWNHGHLDVVQLKLDGFAYAIPSCMVRGVPGSETKIGRNVASVREREQVEALCIDARYSLSRMNDGEQLAFADRLLVFVNALFGGSRSLREVWERDEQEYVLCFGFPTMWSVQDVDVYMGILGRLDILTRTDEFFGRKGVKVSLLSCKRSHAAALNLRRRIHGMQSSQVSGDNKDLMDFIPDGSSLAIINWGDSATEFTVAQNRCGQLNIISDGERGNTMLDTRFIDRAIYDSVLRRLSPAEVANLMKFLQKHPAEQSRLVSFCRLAKEAYFDASKEDRACGRFMVPRPMGMSGCFPIDMIFPENCADIMREALNAPIEEFEGRSWLEECRSLLERVKTDCGRYGSDPKVIYLTGGASRMDFIYEFATALFPDSRVALDPLPSTCIASGLALMPYRLAEAQQFLQAIDKFTRDEIPAIVRYKLPDLADQVASKLQPGVCDRAKSEAKRWRNGYIRTLNGMESEIKSGIASYLRSSAAQSGLGEVVGSFYRNVLMPKVNSRFEEICRQYNVKSRQLIKVEGDMSIGVDVNDQIRCEIVDMVWTTIVTGVLRRLVVAIMMIADEVAIPIASTIGLAILNAMSAAVAALGLESPLFSLPVLFVRPLLSHVNMISLMNILRTVDMPNRIRTVLISELRIDSIVSEKASAVKDEIARSVKSSDGFSDEVVRSVCDPLRSRYVQITQDLALCISD